MKVSKIILIALAFVIAVWILYKTVPYILLMYEEMNDPNFYIGGNLPKVQQ